jgi:hypothetical protein
MEKIVYILGAGFSAPLGLPVMNNFIEKSKDLYFENTEKYGYFEKIYKTIRQDIAYLKHFLHSDLSNIEEILSILEMGNFVGDNSHLIEEYKRFIKDVISHYTPSIIPFQKDDKEESLKSAKPKKGIVFGKSITNFYDYCFGNKCPHNLYGYFIANLFQLRLERKTEVSAAGETIINTKDSNFKSSIITPKEIEYSVITLNYDLVFENIIEYINGQFSLEKDFKLQLSKAYNNNDNNRYKLDYAKLHGSIDSDVIILPTWNKNAAKEVREIWEFAYRVLKDSNQIRILGYSLPFSDNYVRYLLSIGLKNSEHLKKIDVITLDNNAETKKRYEQIFSFSKFRFRNGDVSNYLDKAYSKDNIKSQRYSSGGKSGYEIWQDVIDLKPKLLEDAHEKFMNTAI